VDVAPTPDGGAVVATAAGALLLTAASALLVTRPMVTGARGSLLPGTLPLDDVAVVGTAAVVGVGVVCGRDGERVGCIEVPDVVGGVGMKGPWLLFGVNGAEGGAGTKGRGGLLCPPAPAPPPPAKDSARILDGTAENDGRGLSLPRADATKATTGRAANGLLIAAGGAADAPAGGGEDAGPPATIDARRRKGSAVPSAVASSVPRRRKSSSSNSQSSSSSRAASATSSGERDAPGPAPLLSSSTCMIASNSIVRERIFKNQNTYSAL
jgi:hypothetical protein